MLVQLLCGDWSGDGHNMTAHMLIESNLDQAGIESCYTEGSIQVGFDLVNNVARNCEDNHISEEHESRLKDYGIEVAYEDEYYRDEHSLTPESFTKLYLEIARLGGDFQYTIIEPQVINIGGYGLFYP
jgi:hypothetical protein